MTVRVRPYRGGPALEVDVRVEMEDGSVRRVRKRFKNGRTEAQARQWGEGVQRAILTGKWKGGLSAAPKPSVKTLAEFVPHYLDVLCPANKQKPSYIASKRSFLNCHAIPALGTTRLDEIRSADVLMLKARLQYMKKGSINNHLATLNSVLKAAVEAGEIQRVPCEISLHSVSDSHSYEFYSFEEYDRLISAAGAVGQAELAAILLGGDAGLRVGEVAALKWSDLVLDPTHASVTIGRTAWRGVELTPKNGKDRRVPLTARLHAALREHLRSTRAQRLHESAASDPIALDAFRAMDRFVFCHPNGRRHSTWTIRRWMSKAQHAAGTQATGRFHILRHTFCSHLAARGVPLIDIKDLAGHSSIKTTEKYLHNLPGSKERGIAQLERRHAQQRRTGPGAIRPRFGAALRTGRGNGGKK